MFFNRAEAMLSIVQLMGEHDLYEYFRDNYKVHGTSWNQNKARQILEAWQRAFMQVVYPRSSDQSFTVCHCLCRY